MKKATHIVSCQENYDGTVLSSAVAWRLTATGPMWHRQVNCSRHAQQRQRKNGRQVVFHISYARCYAAIAWWNSARQKLQAAVEIMSDDSINRKQYNT